MVAVYAQKIWPTSVAKALTGAGADIGATDRDRKTALRVAVKHKSRVIKDLC